MLTDASRESQGSGRDRFTLIVYRTYRPPNTQSIACLNATFKYGDIYNSIRISSEYAYDPLGSVRYQYAAVREDLEGRPFRVIKSYDDRVVEDRNALS